MPRHDIVTIGASAGGVETLISLVAGLPADIPAAIFVVVHILPYSPSVLPQILSRKGKLPAVSAEHGTFFENGRIYIAPPDCHLLVQRGTIAVTRGPRENGSRPAIDPLFRSAAEAYGSRVVGVVLSGTLDDGSMGLKAIRECGGKAIVQDPHDAIFREMPQNAISHAGADYVLPISGIAAKLAELAEAESPVEGADTLADEQANDMKAISHDIEESEHRGSGRSQSIYTCPECGGVLWEADEGGALRFACHVGHRYTVESMSVAQGERLEAALWTAVRALEERASLSRKLERRMKAHHQENAAVYYQRSADEAEKNANVIRKILITKP